MAVNLDTILAANNSIVVEGTVEIGATSLAALETIELGATSLAALETIELGAASLAALENITATIDAGSLAALESVTVQNGAAGAAVNIQDGGNSITVDGTVTALQSGFGTWAVTAVSVTTTESTVSALALRTKVEIQNLGSNDIYIRQITGVSSANGFKIPKGSSWEQTLAAGAAIFMVAAAGTSDVRIAQYAV